MLAMAITEPGGPEVLAPSEQPLPSPRPGEILVRVHAAGVNRPDVQQRKGAYPPPPGASPLPGLEVAGEVAEVGEGTGRWKVGDKVCALTNGGGYAEYVAVHGSNALPVPAGFSMREAAAIPETFFTVWHNVFERGALKPGETLLLHGGSSGIGTTAIQLATALGSKVIVTAGSADKCEACLKLGAVRAINYRDEDFVQAVKDETQGKGADVILDMVGGDYVAKNYHAAATDGRIVQIATQKGAVAEADFARLMMKRLTHTGSTLRPRTIEFKGGVAAALEARVWPLLEARKIAPVMDRAFSLREAAEAHRRMEEGTHIGKIVLDVV
ncbi:NAD(P)H-quinone oxidoreductase [Mesorhizobium sp. RP14(2022)]|uniref:NAD(P)H-quinone oxidoreductase n=1 Tax=Mesorhizobium liriopis TaxID=2953882 RepID=A0ABT1C929_9HYPH|nr:NAD(P)H-quinone oxidoreductase [Mesorhizobium liriopis]MCO6051342.1 NAD(P)H-quinone oxidoreductase [Mesorhizobium liriopis]